MIQFLTIMLNARRDDDKGATAVEYGLMVALIAVAIIVAVQALGGSLSSLFDGISGDIDTANGGGGAGGA